MVFLALLPLALADGGPYLLGEFDPAQALLLPSWDAEVDASFVPLVEISLEQGVPVVLCARDAETSASSRAALDAAGVHGAVWSEACQPRTLWMRDYGPIFLMSASGEPMLGDARYAGPGSDDEVPEQLAALLRFPLVEIPVAMEGGNLLPNGEGICLTTETLTSRDFEAAQAALAETTGCGELIVLEPLLGEGTGHVDVFVSLVGPDHALVGEMDPSLDAENAARLDRSAEALDARGFEVGRVPMPVAGDIDGDGLLDFPSALNALLLTREQGGGAVAVPVFPDSAPEADDEALARWAQALPEHEIHPVPADALVLRGGALHCVTRAAPVPRWPRPCEDPYAFNDADPRCVAEPRRTCGVTSRGGGLTAWLAGLLLALRKRRSPPLG